MREMLNPTSADRRYGTWFHGCPDHRRTFQRSIQRSFHRSRITGSSSRRSDRTGRRRRYHQDQHSGNRLELAVSDEELARRKAGWTPREPKVKTGYLARYASMVTSGNRGAILVSEK